MGNPVGKRVGCFVGTVGERVGLSVGALVVMTTPASAPFDVRFNGFW